MTEADGSGILLHAGSVALDGRGVLVFGPSGSGKSALALQLMALGCTLVSDDYTRITLRDGVPYATAPAGLRGRIEARGVGLLAAEVQPAARLVLAIDMGTVESDRLPPQRQTLIAGTPLPLLHRVESGYFPAAIVQYLKAGRSA